MFTISYKDTEKSKDGYWTEEMFSVQNYSLEISYNFKDDKFYQEFRLKHLRGDKIESVRFRDSSSVVVTITDYTGKEVFNSKDLY